jgi:putative membrane protein insertion efficiency factor
MLRKILDATQKGLSLFFQALVVGYQYSIGLVLPNRCRFYPSCSSYALTVLKTHSVPIALSLIVRRLLKCHPFCRGGVDEPPPPKNKRSL